MVMRSLAQVPAGARLFCTRCTTVPFEAATAVLAVWSGVSAFFNLTVAATVVNMSLPGDLVTLFNLLYVLAGAFMLAGIGWNYRNLETTGIIFLFTSLLVRLLVLVAMAGVQLTILPALLQNLTFGAACGARLVFLLKHRALVVIEPPPNGD